MLKKNIILLVVLLLNYNLYADNINKQALDSAIVIMYHKFGVDKSPSTNIKLEQLEQHLQILQQENYNVMSLRKIISTLTKGDNLPPKTIAITIDDGYKSFYDNGWKLFKKHNIPVSLFIAPAYVGYNDFMSWEQLKELSMQGAEIEVHSFDHPHLTKIDDDDINKQLILPMEIIEKKIGIKPQFFSWPFGEASKKLINIIKKTDYIAAFSQHSGAISYKYLQEDSNNQINNKWYLPRFSLNEKYGEISRFKFLLKTKPLILENWQPNSPILSTAKPKFSFNINNKIDYNNLNCYLSDYGKVDINISENKETAYFNSPIEFKLNKRVKVNCTYRYNNGDWGWFGIQYLRIK